VIGGGTLPECFEAEEDNRGGGGRVDGSAGVEQLCPETRGALRLTAEAYASSSAFVFSDAGDDTASGF